MTSSRSSWNRRRFLGTTLAGGAASLAAPPRPRAGPRRERPHPHRRRGHRRPRPLPDAPAQGAAGRPDRGGERRLRAADAGGGRDRRPRRGKARRLPPPPRRQGVRRGPGRQPGPLAPDDGRRRARRRQGRVPREAGVAHARGRRGAPEARRGHEAGRPDRHAAAELGALPPRQADRRLGQARPDHVRPHLLAPADGHRAWPEVDQAKLDWKAWLGSAPEQPWNPRALLPLAALPGLRRRRADRPPHPLDRRRALVHRRRRRPAPR